MMMDVENFHGLFLNRISLSSKSKHSNGEELALSVRVFPGAFQAAAACRSAHPWATAGISVQSACPSPHRFWPNRFGSLSHALSGEILLKERRISAAQQSPAAGNGIIDF